MKSRFLPIQHPPPPSPKKRTNEKQTGKKLCYLQYIHKVQGGTSKYHAFFKIVVQKQNKTKKHRIHASKTVCLKKVVVPYCGVYLHSEISFMLF